MDAFGAATSAVLAVLGGESAWEVFYKALLGVLATSVFGTAATIFIKRLINHYCGNRDQEPDLEEDQGGRPSYPGGNQGEVPSSSGGNQGKGPSSSGRNQGKGPSSSGVSDQYGQDSVFVPAERLQIVHSNNTKHWKLIELQESRFSKAWELLSVWFFLIEAKIKFSDWPLVSQTNYGVYFIFKTKEWIGLDTPLQAKVGNEGKYVCLTRVPQPQGSDMSIEEFPSERGDGWMELKLGQFFCDDNTRGQEVVVTLEDPKNDSRVNIEKKGLIIVGIELRPVIS